MRYIKITLMIIISYILQGSVFAGTKFFGVVPNLIAVCLICFSICENEWFYTGILGAFCGLLLDTSGGAVMGLNTILCMYIAIFCSVFSRKFFRGKFLVSILFVFLVSFVYESLLYIFGFELWKNANVLYCTLNVILPISAYNTVIAAILYVPIRKISNVIE